MLSAFVLQAGKYLLNAVQTAYRFLLVEPDVFSRLWDWSCFLDLVQKLANHDMVDDDKLVKNISDLRWCGLQILSVIFKMNDTAISSFSIGSEEALGCLLRLVLFRLFSLSLLFNAKFVCCFLLSSFAWFYF